MTINLKHYDYECVIIGAGISGISAANTLKKMGIDFLVLEARNRLGGRIFSDLSPFDYPIDKGAQWFHSADLNPLVQMIEKKGHEVNKTNPNWGALHAKNLLTKKELVSCQKEFDLFFHQNLNKKILQLSDTALSCLYPSYLKYKNLLEAVVTFQSGVNSSYISTHDMVNYIDSGFDWSLSSGMGTIFSCFDFPKKISLNTRVVKIIWNSSITKIQTNKGTISCKKVIITVPTSIINQNKIIFHPHLPYKILDSFSNLPLGTNEKVFIEIDDKFLPELQDECIYSRIDSSNICSFQVRPHKKPYIIAFFGGFFIKELKSINENEMINFAIKELENISGIKSNKFVKKVCQTNWLEDEYTFGSYSYAKIGGSEARTKLEDSLDDKLYFAGEAISKNFYSTMHGAYLSGKRAASKIRDSKAL